MSNGNLFEKEKNALDFFVVDPEESLISEAEAELVSKYRKRVDELSAFMTNGISSQDDIKSGDCKLSEIKKFYLSLSENSKTFIPNGEIAKLASNWDMLKEKYAEAEKITLQIHEEEKEIIRVLSDVCVDEGITLLPYTQLKSMSEKNQKNQRIYASGKCIKADKVKALIDKNKALLAKHLAIYSNSFDGEGTQVLDEGRIYKGQIRRGLPHGKGVMEYGENKQRYTGEWEQGLRSGDGELWDTEKNELIYAGSWAHDCVDEQGPYSRYLAAKDSFSSARTVDKLIAVKETFNSLLPYAKKYTDIKELIERCDKKIEGIRSSVRKRERNAAISQIILSVISVAIVFTSLIYGKWMALLFLPFACLLTVIPDWGSSVEIWCRSIFSVISCSAIIITCILTDNAFTGWEIVCCILCVLIVILFEIMGTTDDGFSEPWGDSKVCMAIDFGIVPALAVAYHIVIPNFIATPVILLAPIVITLILHLRGFLYEEFAAAGVVVFPFLVYSLIDMCIMHITFRGDFNFGVLIELVLMAAVHFVIGFIEYKIIDNSYIFI